MRPRPSLLPTDRHDEHAEEVLGGAVGDDRNQPESADQPPFVVAAALPTKCCLAAATVLPRGGGADLLHEVAAFATGLLELMTRPARRRRLRTL